MKWQPGAAYRRLFTGTSLTVTASICMLLDLGVSYAALAGGASLPAGQAAGFIAAAILEFWWIGSLSVTAGRTEQWRLFCSCLLVAVLTFSLRSALIELLVTVWALPQTPSLMFAVIASGLVMYNGYHLCLAAVSRSNTDAEWRALIIGIVGYAFLLRLVYSAQVELLPEETYYWNYCRHLDIGYLDHPPLVAWLIRVGTALFGDSEFGVRCGALCCGATASFFIYRLTRNVFGETSALLALALVQVLPFFFMSGLLMTPDAPLTAAWAAALFFLERALIAGQSRAWLWTGLAFGVGLLSKYTIGLLAAAIFLFMLIDAPSRRWFRRWEPYAAVLIAAAVFAPVIYWNAQHDWASFAFQTSRRLAEQPRFSLHKLIGAAMVLITPTGLAAAAFVHGFPARGPVSGMDSLRRPWRLFEVCLLLPLAVFFLFSLRHEVKLDWTGAPWTAAVPILAFTLGEAYSRRSADAWRWLRSAWPPTVVILLLIYAVGLYYLVLGLPGLGYSKHTELVPVAWRDFGRQIEDVADDVRAKNRGDILVVGMDRYAIASELAFYSSDRSRSVAATSTGHLFGDMGLMYRQWFPARLQSGRTLLLVAWDVATLAPARLESHVTRLDPIREGALVRNGRLIRPYYYRVAYGYRTDGKTDVDDGH